MKIGFITRGPATGRDDRGNATFTPTTRQVWDCTFNPGSSAEVLNGGDQVTTQPTVFAPTGTSVAAVDQLDVPGIGVFDVDGTPEVWGPNPFSGRIARRSVVIKLKQVTG